MLSARFTFTFLPKSNLYIRQEIARELSNSFGATIHIADTALQNYRITARFRNGEDLTTILSVLHNAGYFDYSQNNKQIIITAKPD